MHRELGWACLLVFVAGGLAAYAWQQGLLPRSYVDAGLAAVQRLRQEVSRDLARLRRHLDVQETLPVESVHHPQPPLPSAPVPTQTEARERTAPVAHLAPAREEPSPLVCGALKLRVLADKVRIARARARKEEPAMRQALAVLFATYDDVVRYGCHGYIDVPPGTIATRPGRGGTPTEEPTESSPEDDTSVASPYARSIHEASQAYNLDPDLIRAVIAVESNGEATAVSPKGAIGLMQVLASTGRSMGARPGDLRDPHQNILYGSRYLAYLLGLFEGDVRQALAAYNAGPTRVLAGQRLPAETRAYVPKVLTLWQQLQRRRAS